MAMNFSLLRTNAGLAATSTGERRRSLASINGVAPGK
jgi:hypothetical protein